MDVEKKAKILSTKSAMRTDLRLAQYLFQYFADGNTALRDFESRIRAHNSYGIVSRRRNCFRESFCISQ